MRGSMSSTRRSSSQAIFFDLFIMGAVARQAAFEENEAVHLERSGAEAAPSVQEFDELARSPAFPAREGDVRVKGASFGVQTNRLANALDLGREGSEGLLRFDARP